MTTACSSPVGVVIEGMSLERVIPITDRSTPLPVGSWVLQPDSRLPFEVGSYNTTRLLGYRPKTADYVLGLVPFEMAQRIGRPALLIPDLDALADLVGYAVEKAPDTNLGRALRDIFLNEFKFHYDHGVRRCYPCEVGPLCGEAMTSIRMAVAILRDAGQL